jgi:hypothetical protein
VDVPVMVAPEGAQGEARVIQGMEPGWARVKPGAAAAPQGVVAFPLMAYTLPWRGRWWWWPRWWPGTTAAHQGSVVLFWMVYITMARAKWCGWSQGGAEGRGRPQLGG